MTGSQGLAHGHALRWNTTSRLSPIPTMTLFFTKRGGCLGIQGNDCPSKKLSCSAGLHITPHAILRGFAIEH